jgi:hypothetical protein
VPSFAFAAVRRAVLSITLLTASLVAGSALAADPRVEQQAKALQKKAVEEDYLNVDYAAAIRNLKAAITKCGSDKCQPSLKASVLRDLGAMQILAGSVDEGKLSFTQALLLDGTLDLDPAYKNPMLAAMWEDAKKGSASPPSPAAAVPAVSNEQLPQTGDFRHEVQTEALTRTPLALYVEYDGAGELAHVLAKYKSASMTDWKTIELQKLDPGYGAWIPCGDVSTGSFSYYLQGFNSQNDQIAAAGSRSAPLSIPVKVSIAGVPTTLPGQSPPSQCAEVSGSECPPNFPGCKSASVKKEAGAECAKDAQCKSRSCVDGKCAEAKEAGEICQSDDECVSGACSDGKCAASKKAGGEECESSDECESGRCDSGKCSEAVETRLRHRIWLGVSVQGDIYLMSSGNDVCVVPDNSPLQPGVTPMATGYECVDANGDAYPADPQTDQSITRNYDRVQSGLAFGNVRILASLDVALNPNIMLGGRAGYILRTDPGTGNVGPPFIPVHVEARLTYLIGRNVLLAPTSIAPMVFAGVGVGEFDAFVPVTVETTTPAGVTTRTTENAWQTAGPAFVSAGGGVRAQVSPNFAITAAIKFEAGFGGSAGVLPGFAPELGAQVGL